MREQRIKIIRRMASSSIPPEELRAAKRILARLAARRWWADPGEEYLAKGTAKGCPSGPAGSAGLGGEPGTAPPKCSEG